MGKFKVGDHVRVKDVEVDSFLGVTFVDAMRCLCGLEGTIVGLRESDGMVNQIDFGDPSVDGEWCFADEWLEAVDGDSSSESAVAVDSSLRGFGLYDGPHSLSALKGGLFGAPVWCPLFGHGVVVHVNSADSDLCVKVLWVASLKTTWFTSRGQLSSSVESSPCILWPSESHLSWCCWQAPIRWRASMGESYFYINSKMELASDIDTGGDVHDTRWLCGNYFKAFGNGSEVLKRVVGVLFDSVVK